MFYAHLKTGGVYEVIHEDAVIEADNTPAVVYRGADGKLWVRPAAEFHDGRFAVIPLVNPPSHDEVWTTLDGRKYTVKEMSENHVRNALNMVIKGARLRRERRELEAQMREMIAKHDVEDAHG